MEKTLDPSASLGFDDVIESTGLPLTLGCRGRRHCFGIRSHVSDSGTLQPGGRASRVPGHPRQHRLAPRPSTADPASAADAVARFHGRDGPGPFAVLFFRTSSGSVSEFTTPVFLFIAVVFNSSVPGFDGNFSELKNSVT